MRSQKVRAGNRFGSSVLLNTDDPNLFRSCTLFVLCLTPVYSFNSRYTTLFVHFAQFIPLLSQLMHEALSPGANTSHLCVVINNNSLYKLRRAQN